MTGKELGSPTCAPLFFCAHIPFLRPLRRLEKSTVKTQMYHPSFECGFCALFPFFFRPPTGEGKTYFLFLSPTSRTVTFFAGYHRNILSISLFCEEGETRAKGRNECLFVRSSSSSPPTPSTQLTKGVTLELKSYAIQSFDQISVSAANTLAWFVCSHTFPEKQEKKDGAYSLDKI